MNLALSDAVEQRIKEHIESGRFKSAEEVVEAAIAGFDELEWDDSLTDEDVAAIAEADEEFDRGEVVSLEEVRAKFAEKYKELK